MNKVLSKDSKLTKEQVAAAVMRTVVSMAKDGSDVTEKVAIKPREVMDWAEYPDTDELVVVTIDGQRFTGKLPAAKK